MFYIVGESITGTMELMPTLTPVVSRFLSPKTNSPFFRAFIIISEKILTNLEGKKGKLPYLYIRAKFIAVFMELRKELL